MTDEQMAEYLHLTAAEAAAYAEHLRQLNWMETNDKHLN